jgi:chromosome partitioning protein
MKTIVLAATKGGTGKTSLAFNIGIEAAKHGTVFLADMDPQKSLETFCGIRSGDNPLLLAGVESVPRAIADLNRTGYARDFLIVDSPGSFMSVITDALKAADCVIVPLQPSPVDLLAQEDVFKLVAKLGKMDRTICVLNRVDGRTRINGILERLPCPHVEVRNRIAYSRALVAGQTGAELDKECAPEIAALWDSVQSILGVHHG